MLTPPQVRVTYRYCVPLSATLMDHQDMDQAISIVKNRGMILCNGIDVLCVRERESRDTRYMKHI